ncbi:MAG: TolC family protein [Candidatus Omnitrophica bacterium]|nr:TolC family protein [Candidatus Omnitrophota bacterium]
MRKDIYSYMIFVLMISLTLALYAEEERGGLETSQMLPLSLSDTLKIAVLNNFEVQIARYDKAISDADLDDALSVYDAVMEIEAGYTHSELEQITSLTGQVSEDYETNVKMSKKFRYGTGVDIDYNYLRHRTDSAFAQINPSEQSYVQFTFTQPLLKNMFGINDWRDVRITRIEVDNFTSETLDTIEKTLLGVEIAYWELLLVGQMEEIRKDAWQKADDFRAVVESKEELGSAELTDLYAAKANLRVRSAELLAVGADLRTAENDMKFLMNNKEAGSDIRIIPVEKLEIGDTDVQLVPALTTAFENRRDYKRAMKDIEAKDIELKIRDNERWPQLDLEGSFMMNGIRRSWWGSIEDLTEETNTEYYAGATLSIPLDGREEKSAFDKATYEKAKALVELKRIEKEILLDIDSKVKKVNTDRQRIRELSEAVELQEKKMNEEGKKYKYGRSDADRVTRFQQDYMDAELALRLATLDYIRSLGGLYVSQNIYLEERNLTVR